RIYLVFKHESGAGNHQKKGCMDHISIELTPKSKLISNHHGFRLTFLGVSRSGHYAWAKRPESQQKKRQEALKKQIKKIHIESREAYGSPKITEILQKQGVKVSQKTVARIMKDGDIRSKTKKYKATTNSKHHSPVYPNLFFTRPLQQGKRSNIGFLNILSVFIMPSEFILLMSTCLRWRMRRCISKAKSSELFSPQSHDIRGIFPLEKGKGLPNRSPSQEATSRLYVSIFLT
ncbi:IS3 family transposase, partial [Anoxybacillus flavithermus]